MVRRQAERRLTNNIRSRGWNHGTQADSPPTWGSFAERGVYSGGLESERGTQIEGLSGSNPPVA